MHFLQEILHSIHPYALDFSGKSQSSYTGFLQYILKNLKVLLNTRSETGKGAEGIPSTFFPNKKPQISEKPRISILL